MPTVEIVGVGAYVCPAGKNVPRPYRKGQRPNVDQATADQLVRAGVAIYVEAHDQEPEQGDGPPPLADQTVRELRATAKDRGVKLGDATAKRDIIAVLEAATQPSVEPVDLTALDDDALLALAAYREVEVPADADRDALITLLTPEDGDGA